MLTPGHLKDREINYRKDELAVIYVIISHKLTRASVTAESRACLH